MSLGQTIADRRPLGVTALSIFFFAATVITLLAAVSLLFPNGFLEPIWKLKPRGRTGLGAIGIWAVLLFSVVCVACAVAAVGLWRGARYGYATAITVLTINSLGDLFNVISGTEPRAVVGIPIVIVILVYMLTEKVRRFFRASANR